MQILGSTFPRVMSVLEKKLAPEDRLIIPDRSRPLVEQIGEADVLILGGWVVPREVLEAAPRLRLIHQQGRGVERLDLKAATELGIRVCNVVGNNSVSVAEHAFMLMMFLSRKMPEMREAVEKRIVGSPEVIELRNKTLAIVGFGASGYELFARARAFGMRVLATRARPELRDARAERALEQGLEFLGGPSDLHRVLEEADFVSLHLPVDDRTRGLIGRAELARMKRSAFLINTARGPLVDHDALLEVLRARAIAGAAFDSFWVEPADPQDPLLALDNFVLTPHVAGFSDTSIAIATDVIADNLVRLREGRPLVNLLNPEAHHR